MPEAQVKDGVPQTAGWFVLNAADGPWLHNDLRAVCRFGGQGDAHFDELGFALYWIEPGQAMTMYHAEGNQEDFLVLQGACVLIVEGVERPLGAWDLFHCPPGTPHAIAAADEPALILAVGARNARGSVHYPVDAAALRHGAGVAEATSSPAEAYARFTEPHPGPPPEFPGSSQPAPT
jgi:uncharacterized cupin superfamily protein